MIYATPIYANMKATAGRSSGTCVQDLAYDGARTIQIPEAARAKLTASQKQYWDVKAKYLDVVCCSLHTCNASYSLYSCMH